MEYHNLNNQVVKESLEVESSSSFDPTKGLKSGSPVKDSTKTVRNSKNHPWVGLHPLARPLR
ncbi:hypothetical protein [Mycoplasmoides genitalium]|uniref:hypothetical protein n=1 Tax=Mycoplasmoides genitalium TaxID=2097 RepID=UPI004055801C